MDQTTIRIHKRVGFIILAIAVVFAILIAALTYIHEDFTSKSHFITWVVANHLIISVVLVFVAALSGYLLSSLTFGELKKTRKQTSKVMDILLVFLSKEERAIITYLVEQQGTADQADIARLPGLNGVRAYRTLQKLRSRDLIDIIPHGKMRRISLKEDIHNVLREQKSS